MIKLKGYIKRHLGLIFALFVLFLMQGTFLLTSNVSLDDMAYLLGLELVILFVILMIDFLLYLNKCKKLEKLLQHVEADYANLEETGECLDDNYIGMMKAQARSRMRTENHFRNKAKEMADYYNMWVHQIKTPIAGMSVLLQCMESTEEVRELGNSLFSIEQYADMALQYQRIEAEGNDFKFADVDLDKLIREQIRKYARLFIAKKLSMKYEGTTLKALTDEKWLAFVLGQVLTNAIKYSKNPEKYPGQSFGIEITVTEDEKWIWIAIKDQGIGVSPEDLPRVFERGYTGYNGRANRSSTGIGLFLCKQVMDKLGHVILMESEPDEGSIVKLGLSRQKFLVND